MIRRINESSASLPSSLLADRHDLPLPSGWFSHVRLAEDGKRDLRCPLQGNDTCALYAFFDRAAGRWREPLAAPASWDAFAVHEGRVLVARENTIEMLTPGEKPKEWATLPSAGVLSFAVLPTKHPSLVVGQRGSVSLFPLIEEGGQRRTGEPTDLGLSLVYAPTAQAARSSTEPLIQGTRPSRAYWGILRAFAFASTWGLVITEVKPPPSGSREGVSFLRRSKARHECATPSSRHLRDPSVRKDLLLLTYRGTRKIAEQIVWTRDDFDADRDPVEIIQTGQQVTIDGQTFDAQGHLLRRGERPAQAAPAYSPLPAVLLDDERVDLLSFDELSGEGVVVFHDADSRSFATVFSAKPGDIRKPVTLPISFSDSAAFEIERVGDGFVALVNQRDEAVWLSGPRGGLRALIPSGDRGQLVCDLLLHADAGGLHRRRLLPGGAVVDLGTLKEPSLLLHPLGDKPGPTCLRGVPHVWVGDRERVLRADTGELLPAADVRIPRAPTSAPECRSVRAGPHTSVLACAVASSPREASIRAELRWISD